MINKIDRSKISRLGKPVSAIAVRYDLEVLLDKLDEIVGGLSQQKVAQIDTDKWAAHIDEVIIPLLKKGK